jgi:urease accessory protein
MLFRDAEFHTEYDAYISPGGALLLSDILCAGRVGRGEAFAFRNYCNRLRVHTNDELIFCNQMRFQPQQQNLRAVGAWGDNTHYGTFSVFSSSVDLHLLKAMRRVMNEHSNIYAGASLTHKNGVIVSALATSAWALQELFGQLSTCAKRHVCHA